MNEAAIENQSCQIATQNGWFVRKAEWVGRRACPDRVFIKRGRTVWIEFKDPNGKLSELQKREIARMRAAGAEVHVCDSVADFCEFMDLPEPGAKTLFDG